MQTETAYPVVGDSTLAPMLIARHPLFTAREKLGLLQAIRAEISAPGTASDLGTDEVDAAIADVKQRIESGAGNAAVLEDTRDGQ